METLINTIDFMSVHPKMIMVLSAIITWNISWPIICVLFSRAPSAKKKKKTKLRKMYVARKKGLYEFAEVLVQHWIRTLLPNGSTKYVELILIIPRNTFQDVLRPMSLKIRVRFGRTRIKYYITLQDHFTAEASWWPNQEKINIDHIYTVADGIVQEDIWFATDPIQIYEIRHMLPAVETMLLKADPETAWQAFLAEDDYSLDVISHHDVIRCCTNKTRKCNI